MAEEPLTQLGNPQPPAPAEDMTGRSRMAWNVVASWAGHMVFVVAGFIMPRLIDRHLGQVELGVWDFGWSLVSYFGLVQVGVGSSVNRYVARYRAANLPRELNCAIASVMCIQMVVALIIAGLTAGATWLVPSLLTGQLGSHVDAARWVVFLLGTSLAIQFVFDAFNGVVTGCHRWDLHNGINAGFYALIVAGMIVILHEGRGLKSIATVYVVGVVVTEITRAFVAHRVCPELHIRLRDASWSRCLEMLTFGGKSFLNSLSRLLMYQTNSLLIVGFLGPAALALYSRPRSLVGNAQTFVSKFSYVLIPTTSSLQAAGQHEELRSLMVNSGRYAAYMALPMVLLLVIMGDPILSLWMGSKYSQGMVLAILAVGHLTEMTRQPIVSVLTGMNLHGRLGFINLGAAVVSVTLSAITLGVLHWGLVGAALSLAVPLVLVNGIFVPVYACRRLDMPVWRYLSEANRKPLLLVVPFAVILVASRLCFVGYSSGALAYGLPIASAVLLITYWYRVFSAEDRGRMYAVFGRASTAGDHPRASEAES